MGDEASDQSLHCGTGAHFAEKEALTFGRQLTYRSELGLRPSSLHCGCLVTPCRL